MLPVLQGSQKVCGGVAQMHEKAPKPQRSKTERWIYTLLVFQLQGAHQIFHVTWVSKS